jgi:hypothetical protein
MRQPARWRMTAARATRDIRERAAESRRVAVTLHAQERMVERDIIMPELFRILREGTVRDDPERVGDGWKATMELRLPGGADAAAVTVIADGNGLRVVTVMWREAR